MTAADVVRLAAEVATWKALYERRVGQDGVIITHQADQLRALRNELRQTAYVLQTLASDRFADQAAFDTWLVKTLSTMPAPPAIVYPSTWGGG